MRKLTLIFAAALLPACTPLSVAGAVADGISVHADSVTLEATKALAIAADAYATAANSAAAAVRVDTPHLTDDQLRLIQTLNNNAAKLLSGADSTLTVAQRAAGLSLIVTQLHSIIGK